MEEIKMGISIEGSAIPWKKGWISCLNCIHVVKEEKSLPDCALFPDMVLVDDRDDNTCIFRHPPIATTACGQGVFVIRGNPMRLLTYQQWFQEFVLPEYERMDDEDK